MFCLNDSIIDPNEPQSLNQCHIYLYLLSPSYLVLSIISAYSSGSRGDFARNRKLPLLKIIRFTLFILLCITLADTFTKYFMPFSHGEPAKMESLISQSYKLSALLVHTFVIFNKNLFFPRFPVKLLISLVLTLFANCIHFINSYERLKNFNTQSLNEKCNLIFEANFVFFLLVYLIFILSSYRKRVQGFLFLNDDTIESEEDTASYYSYLTFEWFKPVMKKGYERSIRSVNDLSRLPKYLNTRLVNLNFMSQYSDADEYLRNPIVDPSLLQDVNFMQTHSNYEDVAFNQANFVIKNKLIKTLVKSFGKDFLFLGFLRLLNDLLGFSGPILLNQLVQFVQIKESELKIGIYYAMALFFSTLVGSLISVHFTNLLNKFCLRVRSALISLVYRKAVVVKLNEMNDYSIGQIVNFMSIDTDSIVNAFPSFHSCWSLPFQLVITLYLLYLQIGLSFMVGVIFDKRVKALLKFLIMNKNIKNSPMQSIKNAWGKCTGAEYNTK
ncbi:Multidrug resistance-associated 7 [Brachionus plicatilis]|uniref:Multidrug resistance-associated 7 n=1 Tax=Brachionus plicatilis TaxID=10195 RepID=A0A3M7SHQ8_BRAPC|nr:Multidrug resistance-associated 7 [Brachionus plicatilis]